MLISQVIQIGHLHPLLVHLPIGILTLGFILEIYFRKKTSETSTEILLVVLFIGGISSLTSLGTGWLLGEDGGYDETLLFRHRWLAVAFTIFSVLLYFLKKSTAAMAKRLYFPSFILVMVLLGITGHYGGSMTHGEDYLFIDNSIKKVIIEDVEKAKVYADIIQPILDNKCVSCHNPSKIKGGLLMNSKENLLAGGDSGSILDSISNEEAPRILQRLHLALTNEEHMPPKGKVQPTPEEIALIAWWVANDNCFDCITGVLDKTKQIQGILESLEEDTSIRALIAKEVDEVPDAWLANLGNSNISAYRLAADNPLLFINMGGRENITDKDLKSLKKYSENIVEMNLSNSNFNDTLSTVLPSFKNLTKLQLQNTRITDKTIEKLKNLKYLESLNLYGTQITNNALNSIKELPNLKTLYLWQTQITTDAMAKYALDHTTVTVQGQIAEAVFASTTLEPPTINAETDFFKNSLEVVLDYVFDDADIYYTMDGSEPDSTSFKYSKPIILLKSAQIKASTHKSGWPLSKTVARSFKKTIIDYASIDLNKKPNGKYKGHGGKTLIDLKRGSINFVDGNWIGYEGSNFTATIQLKKDELISTVSVGAFSSPEKWIFYPTGFRIWVSDNGTDYALVHNSTLPSEKLNSDTKFRFFELDIPPTKAKFVRIEVKSQLKNPSWHPNPGGNSWLFVDEIVLN